MAGYPGCTLHQIGPYIGKIRPSLARQLVMAYTKKGDWVWDPFCGSGTIPAECRLLGRHIIAADINPYACTLTRAKLHAPISERICLAQLASAVKESKRVQKANVVEAPQWVRDFFHERTLKETIALVQVFSKKRQYFNLGCLLGILHHQRPGFLSYPASHLVPYLRDRLYPRELYPQAYKYRDPIPRLHAKIKRALGSPPLALTSRFGVLQKSSLKRYLSEASVDVVITSPPYMDALDYARDNRLRLWFLGLEDYRVLREEEMRRIGTFNENMLISLQNISPIIIPGGVCVLIIGDVRRNNKEYDVPDMICEIVKTNVRELSLNEKWTEIVPHHRRARSHGRATKKETVLVFRRSKGGSHG